MPVGGDPGAGVRAACGDGGAIGHVVLLALLFLAFWKVAFPVYFVVVVSVKG